MLTTTLVRVNSVYYPTYLGLQSLAGVGAKTV